MQGAATQAMSVYIVEERQHSRCPAPPEPAGRMGIAGDLFVARRQRCTSTSPPPHALSSPRKTHARDPLYFHHGLLVLLCHKMMDLGKRL
jgi:hypothetical protein